MPVEDWNADLASAFKSFAFDLGFFVMAFTYALRSKRRKIQIALLSLFAVYCSPIPDWCLRSWLIGSGLSDPKICADPAVPVVVLGGGIADRNLPSITSQSRLIKAAEIMKAAHNRVFVVSGGMTHNNVESLIYKRYLEMIAATDIGRNTIIPEIKSQNTYQNAAYSREVFESHKLPLKAWIVTSDLHMRRSLATYKKQGFQVCGHVPAPPVAERQSVFSVRNASTTYALLNEILGLAGYRLKGWI